jgi:hypothetical protein
MRRTTGILLGLTLPIWALGAAAEDPALAPYRAEYSLALHGVSAGLSEFSLSKDADDTYTYYSAAHTTGLLGMLKPHYKVAQVSRFSLADGRPQPLDYSYEQSDGDDKSTETIHFDWGQKLAHGLDQGRKHNYALSAGMSDVFLIQLMLATDAATGRLADKYQILDHGEISSYSLQRLPGQKVQVGDTEVDAQVVALHDAKKGRTITVWLAPSLHYLPVQINQDKPSVNLSLNSISFGGAPAAAQ